MSLRKCIKDPLNVWIISIFNSHYVLMDFLSDFDNQPVLDLNMQQESLFSTRLFLLHLQVTVFLQDFILGTWSQFPWSNLIQRYDWSIQSLRRHPDCVPLPCGPASHMATSCPGLVQLGQEVRPSVLHRPDPSRVAPRAGLAQPGARLRRWQETFLQQLQQTQWGPSGGGGGGQRQQREIRLHLLTRGDDLRPEEGKPWGERQCEVAQLIPSLHTARWGWGRWG